MYLIFLDSETSGLDPYKYKILEIAYKIIDTKDWSVASAYSSYVKYSKSVYKASDPISLSVNGISFEDIFSGKLPKKIESDIISNFSRVGITKKNSVFICQNPSFDRPFFRQIIPEEKTTELGWPYHWLDLASMYWYYRISYEGYSKLKGFPLSKDTIAEFCGLERETKPHKAMNGVNHLIQCYETLFRLHR